MQNETKLLSMQEIKLNVLCVFNISGVLITYLMTNQSLFSTFKHNIFLIKILADAALTIP